MYVEKCAPSPESFQPLSMVVTLETEEEFYDLLSRLTLSAEDVDQLIDDDPCVFPEDRLVANDNASLPLYMALLNHKSYLESA